MGISLRPKPRQSSELETKVSTSSLSMKVNTEQMRDERDAIATEQGEEVEETSGSSPAKQ